MKFTAPLDRGMKVIIKKPAMKTDDPSFIPLKEEYFKPGQTRDLDVAATDAYDLEYFPVDAVVASQVEPDQDLGGLSAPAQREIEAGKQAMAGRKSTSAKKSDTMTADQRRALTERQANAQSDAKPLADHSDPATNEAPRKVDDETPAITPTQDTPKAIPDEVKVEAPKAEPKPKSKSKGD